MSALPRLPELLPAENAEALSRAVAGLEPSALWWLSGYAAGLAHARGGAVAVVPPGGPQAAAHESSETEAAARLTVIYGSQTGNAKRLAESVVAEAEAIGLTVRLFRADAYPLRELKDERLLSIIISTQGEGDPPDDSMGFLEFLQGRRAPPLKQLQFAILGLGDSSYARFCEMGRVIDARLTELGARRIGDRADADVDIEATAAPWRAQLLTKLRELQSEASITTPRATVTPLRRPSPATVTRDAPASLELIVQQRISGRDSEKDVRHFEFDLGGAALDYEPGDALGVWADNPPGLVDAVVRSVGLDAEAIVQLDTDKDSLAGWLSSRRELTRSGRGLLLALAEAHEDPVLHEALASPAQTAAWLGATPPIEALQRWQRDWTPQALLKALRPMAPRLYSIASSRAEVGDEAHLTVDVLRYHLGSTIHVGAASNHLARKQGGERVRAFIEPNERFRLPVDGSRDLIMVGAGTGIAPYRGFLQQRRAVAAQGRHWLLFGAQRFASDFLYQSEWLEARKQGYLQRIDLAFSRDQSAKVYVQQRLREQGRQIYAWLQEGAHFYLCGGIGMGQDVQSSLIALIAEHGACSAEAAANYVRELQQAGRFHKDVY